MPLLFSTCKKEDYAKEIVEEPSNITISNVWQLSLQSTYLTKGDFFAHGTIHDISNGIMYTGMIQYVGSTSIMVSNDTIFPGVSTSYSSRIWSVNENQLIIDTYYDENGFSYNISQHNFTKISDTVVVNFQSGDIKKFVINELTSDQFNITSIPDTTYIPLFDGNGVYKDTVLINLTSYKYFFNKVQ